MNRPLGIEIFGIVPVVVEVGDDPLDDLFVPAPDPRVRVYERSVSGLKVIGGHHGWQDGYDSWHQPKPQHTMGRHDLMLKAQIALEELRPAAQQEIASAAIPIMRMFKGQTVTFDGMTEDQVDEIMGIASSNRPVQYREPESSDYWEDDEYDPYWAIDLDEVEFEDDLTPEDIIGFDPFPMVDPAEVLRSDQAARVKADMYDPERTGNEDGFVLDDDLLGGIGTTVRKEHNLGAIGASYFGRTTRSAIN